MKRDWLDLVPKPKNLIRRLKALALGTALTGIGLGSATNVAAYQPSGGGVPAEPILTPTIVDRSMKVGKLVLRLPGQVVNLIAQHRSHSSHASHSSHSSHSSHVSGSTGVVAPPPPPRLPAVPSPPPRPAATATSSRVQPLMTIEPGKEYRPTGSVDFYDWLGPNFTVMTADQIAKDATRFIVQGTDSYGAKNFFKVEVRSPTGVKIGWVPVPVIAPVGASLPTTPSAPVTQASGTAAESLTMGQFASFDRTTKVLTIKDLIGASFEFAVRDDTMLSTSTGASRLDDYLESNFNNYPWSFGQLVSITWKPSVDGKRRVAISIR